ncbi:hypothetical protein KY290_009106 [Solanum tuberosum]|uniref:NB-ARC domain-containing protein n=1 Tax=Solanum tuberosum TaxID=4113 RepID=A0ABQ7WAU7_SOLTU|nr:hypothetical protein KY290_009106 [Solanum tuberosum]
MPVGLHLMMMQTQVPRISILHAVDPAEHSRVSGEPPCFRRTQLFRSFSFVMLGCCGVCPNIHLKSQAKGSLGGQQWSPSASPAQGVGSGRDRSNQEMSDDELMEIVYRGLKGRRFLIFIDDIWSTEAWDQMQRIFPNDDNKSRILLTTRLKYVADYVNCPDFPPHKRICSVVSKFKLLKVLDVLSLWYDFSCVIPELVHLSYVAARIEKALSLDKLRNLQIIILQENIGVNRPTKLEQPLDIWRMSELRHVDIDSPLYISNPLEAKNPLFLNNLQNLYLYNSHFIVEIIKRTPINLKKLKFIDESEHPDWSAILDSLILLEELETLLIKLESIDLNIFSGDILSCKIKKLSPNIKKLILLGMKDEEIEGYLKEAGDDYTASHYILPHLLNFWDKKPLRNRETVKVSLVGRVMEVSRRASMLFTDALVGFGKDPSM